MNQRIRRREFLQKAGLGALALAGIGTSTRLLLYTHHAHADELDDFIDPEIVGEEREIMRAFLAKLEPRHRDNVVYVDANCRIFVNRVRLRSQVGFMQPVGPNLVRARDGELVVLPQQDESEPEDQLDPSAILICDPLDGPYRRIRSKQGSSTRPYSRMFANIYLPSKAKGEVKAGEGETPYIYSGGWGTIVNNNLDAGLQHNKGADNWSLHSLPKGCKPQPIELIRFSSGQEVYFDFSIYEDDRYLLHAVGYTELYVNGKWVKTNKSECVTCQFKHDGLKTSGIYNRIKRITSIAQGTYKPNTGAFLRNVHWSNVQIGKYGDAASFHLWSASDTGHNCVYPSTAKVYVDFRSFSEEIVHILNT